MSTPLAWLNLTHRKARTLAALTGVTMAIVLIFLQLGFYRAGFKSAVIILEQFDYGVAIVSREYVFLRQPGSLLRSRLDQARAAEGVNRVAPLYLGVALAQVPSLDAKRELAILGVDPANSLWMKQDAGNPMSRLSRLDTVLLDTKVGPGYEKLKKGLSLELDGHRVRIIDDFTHGPGFTGSAALIAGDQTYARIFDLPDRNSITLGLVKLESGADPEAIKARLEAIMPSDVRVLTRGELEQGEQNWSINVKPVGIMFTSGLLLAFTVGAVILYQILATEIINNLREYATLRAMGCSTFTLNMLIWKQAVLYAVLGYLPATVLATLIYAVIDSTTTLPTEMTAGKLAAVFLIATIMCIVSGSAAVRKVSRADPADLF